MKTSDFYFDLPEELIAQEPLKDRSSSRLLVADKNTESISHRHFRDIKEYLKARQKNGKDLCTAEVYEETWKWLRDRGCDKLVKKELIEQYALYVTRWIQCEEGINQYGLLAKHPTTQMPIASPYVNMGLNFLKQANVLWLQIYQIVKENCETPLGNSNPNDDLMERLLG